MRCSCSRRSCPVFKVRTRSVHRTGLRRTRQTARKMACDTIILLPDELVAYILEDKRLDVSDVVNFSLTCKHLHKIVNDSNKLWQTKFFQRWPLLKEAYQTHNVLRSRVLDWKEEIKASIDSRRKLLRHLSLMSSKHYKKKDLTNSDYVEYNALFQPGEGIHPLAYYFLMDELISLIKRPAIANNLTHRYYALKVVRYLKQCHLKNEWQKFISLPSQEQIVERGATIVAEWSQPERHITYSYISSILDNITEQTKALLKEQHPSHSIFSTPAERFAYWKNNIINDNQWSVSETKQIMDALCQVLFQNLGFNGVNSEMFYSLENSFIDYALERKRGIPIIIATVFESVARRLGIRCEPVIFPNHFFLRWKETYGPESEDAEKFYVDVFNGGQFVTKKNCRRIAGATRCPIERYNSYEAATAVEVVSRMANNLEKAASQHTHVNGKARFRSALELQHMVQPNNIDTVWELGKLYHFQHMDLTELIQIFENMRNDLEPVLKERANSISQKLQMYQNEFQPEEEIEPRHREPNVKYAVGLIMKHKIHEYLCVISAWDPWYMASPERIIEMNVHEEDDCTDQPFYYVFVDDGTFRYAAQENLFLAPNPQWVDHHAIGKHFYKFKDTHYVPNEEKAREYPEDEEVRNELLRTYM